MSALGGKADVTWKRRRFRFDPISDIGPSPAAVEYALMRSQELPIEGNL
jgi:hypothetical protein